MIGYRLDRGAVPRSSTKESASPVTVGLFLYTGTMKRALRGINLGGWLVVERWMTPQLFKGATGEGEAAFVRSLGAERARKRLIAHRDTFITEKDFSWIARQGYDFVRVPVGYWLLEKTKDFIEGEAYIEKAFAWAQRNNLKVVLDFHGLQGSQNGQDHSGLPGKVRFYRWYHQRRALRTLNYLCRAYGAHPQLLAIEVINEPKIRWFLWPLFRYYGRAIQLVGKSTPERVKIIVSDGFQPLRVARRLARARYRERLVLDVHLYQAFSEADRSLSFEEHIKKVETDWWPLLQKLNGYLPVYIGEWSAALPGAASQEQAQTYYRAQQAVFATTTWAYSYWSYRAPGAGAWSLRDTKLN